MRFNNKSLMATNKNRKSKLEEDLEDIDTSIEFDDNFYDDDIPEYDEEDRQRIHRTKTEDSFRDLLKSIDDKLGVIIDMLQERGKSAKNEALQYMPPAAVPTFAEQPVTPPKGGMLEEMRTMLAGQQLGDSAGPMMGNDVSTETSLPASMYNDNI